MQLLSPLSFSSRVLSTTRAPLQLTLAIIKPDLMLHPPALQRWVHSAQAPNFAASAQWFWFSLTAYLGWTLSFSLIEVIVFVRATYKQKLKLMLDEKAGGKAFISIWNQKQTKYLPLKQALIPILTNNQSV